MNGFSDRMKPAVYQAESSIGFCHISFLSSNSLRKMKAKMTCPTLLWGMYTDPGTLSNTPECALGIPGPAPGVTLYGFMPQSPGE